MLLARLISLHLDTVDGLTIAHYEPRGLKLLTVNSNNCLDLLQATECPFLVRIISPAENILVTEM